MPFFFIPFSLKFSVWFILKISRVLILVFYSVGSYLWDNNEEKKWDLKVLRIFFHLMSLNIIPMGDEKKVLLRTARSDACIVNKYIWVENLTKIRFDTGPNIPSQHALIKTSFLIFLQQYWSSKWRETESENVAGSK